MAGIHAEGVAWTDCKAANMMVRSLELTEDRTCLKHGVTFLDFGGATSTQDGELIGQPWLAASSWPHVACLSASSATVALLSLLKQGCWALEWLCKTLRLQEGAPLGCFYRSHLHV